MYFEDDEILGGTPKSRFFDVIFHANRNVVQEELERLIEWMAALELLVEERCGVEDLEGAINQILHDQERAEDLQRRVNSLYIEYMGQILSKSE
ncbi:MAG: DUF2018 domain-containing protein [Nitratiruptor sp.]|nr:DUF2018 domain-containing protein [Nitratiruptor sp.]NPA83287.1 DUF2018 family protein [Campylobacterota bacterium]